MTTVHGGPKKKRKVTAAAANKPEALMPEEEEEEQEINSPLVTDIITVKEEPIEEEQPKFYKL